MNKVSSLQNYLGNQLESLLAQALDADPEIQVHISCRFNKEELTEQRKKFEQIQHSEDALKFIDKLLELEANGRIILVKEGTN